MPIGIRPPLLLAWMTGTGVPGDGMSGLPGQAVVLRMQRPPPLHDMVATFAVPRNGASIAALVRRASAR